MSYEYPAGSQPPLPSSTTAIISLVAGILGFTFLPIIGSIVALITGYMAKREIQESAGRLGGDGLATIGIVLGWIGVGLSVLGICAFVGAIALGLSPLLCLPFIDTSDFNSLLPWLLAF